MFSAICSKRGNQATCCPPRHAFEPLAGYNSILYWSLFSRLLGNSRSRSGNQLKTNQETRLSTLESPGRTRMKGTRGFGFLWRLRQYLLLVTALFAATGRSCTGSCRPIPAFPTRNRKGTLPDAPIFHPGATRKYPQSAPPCPHRDSISQAQL